ncbi:DUF982 domain-containing protein [Rhizobium lentis]|uniref:DUF982 domain-containing protein n=1 Tax=Rhizobium lentis TaxID=1138194 RepID=A0A9Q3QXU6_9HYPH|nr:DUF982 domain-containing protein [Rhizobium lentis]MBX4972879.1 DUF982 domain-containing protein [Rhizobium lentis]MBX4998372.1 DUF982 domain-containing protein [Rhizobium lentis]MBX5017185.1 DUF982 domain-containing protein [Rhizobium lentis]MBX5023300.1 DUF982 domain-containing protein [Rhizobium lentis]MBX5040893.1 DUF982 domain-containing protein [Rhizobium lentis]
MPSTGLVDWHRSEDFAPLMLVMSGPEKHRLVRSLGEVADALINAWPTDDGKEYVAAIKTCLDAIQGHIPVKVARAALIRAADEARIRVIAVVD